MEVEGGLLGGLQLRALGALEVGVEHEPARRVAGRVEPFQQGDAHVGRAAGIHGRQRHGVGIVGLVRLGLGEPRLEQRERFVGVGEIAGLRGRVVVALELVRHRCPLAPARHACSPHLNPVGDTQKPLSLVLCRLRGWHMRLCSVSLAACVATASIFASLVMLQVRPLAAQEKQRPAEPAPCTCSTPEQAPSMQPRPRFADHSQDLDDNDEIAALEAIRVALTEVGDGATYVWHRNNGCLSGRDPSDFLVQGWDGAYLPPYRADIDHRRAQRPHRGRRLPPVGRRLAARRLSPRRGAGLWYCRTSRHDRWRCAAERSEMGATGDGEQNGEAAPGHDGQQRRGWRRCVRTTPTLARWNQDLEFTARMGTPGEAHSWRCAKRSTRGTRA